MGLVKGNCTVSMYNRSNLIISKKYTVEYSIINEQIASISNKTVRSVRPTIDHTRNFFSILNKQNTKTYLNIDRDFKIKSFFSDIVRAFRKQMF